MDESQTLPFTAFAFNQLLAQKKLMVSRCRDCGSLYLPPRAVCPACRSCNLEWSPASGKGRLAAFTSIAIGPSFMNEQGFSRDNPYISCVVELEEGLKISARITGVDAKNPASIQIGLPLEVEFLEVGDKTYLAFRPME
jgi:uncharacterized protein